MAANPAPRRRMPRAERERQMLDVAEQVFAEQGYQAASMDDIAGRVGVSKPMLYEYFGSKDGLLLACIARISEDLRVATQTAAEQATRPRDALWRGLVAYFTFVDEHVRAWSVLLQNSVITLGPAVAAVEGIRQQQTGLVTEVFGRYLPAADRDELAAYAHIIIGGCERLAIGRPPGATPQRLAQYIMDLIWPGLAERFAPLTVNAE